MPSLAVMRATGFVIAFAMTSFAFAWSSRPFMMR
jgi:hypothetical protein